jgi:hypothetical protein
MQGYCSICGEFTREVAPCPICKDLIGLCCYVAKTQCCISCKLEGIQVVDGGDGIEPEVES